MNDQINSSNVKVKKYPVKRGQVLEVDIENVAFGGKGICRVDNYVIFVPNTFPGDRANVKITKRKQGFGEARILEIITPSKLRQPAPCQYFEWCGGCTWQNISYDQQIEYKKNHVQESIEHLAGIKDAKIFDPIRSKKLFAYRNKMEFSFSDRRWLLPHELGDMNISKSFALGLHVPGTFDKILSVSECLLQCDIANEILKYVNEYCIANELVPYGLRTHEGLLRFLVIRQSSYNNEIMVNIVTAYRADKVLGKLAKLLSEKFKNIVSIVNTINDRKAQIAYGEKEVILYGRNFIIDKIFNFEFKISANSFFQTNTRQAEQLYQIVFDYADVNKNDVVWDLYSGTGTIALFFAGMSKFVHGFEIVEKSVQDAKQNAKEFGINNTSFHAGDLLHNLDSVSQKPDVIVVDPPRSGMHPKVVQFLNTSGARKIVYVSCNPTTMARDIKLMNEDYRLIQVQPADMFPQTYHIECVSLLEKK